MHLNVHIYSVLPVSVLLFESKHVLCASVGFKTMIEDLFNMRCPQKIIMAPGGPNPLFNFLLETIILLVIYKNI